MTEGLVEEGTMRFEFILEHVGSDVRVLSCCPMRLFAEGKVDTVHLVTGLQPVVPIILRLLAMYHCDPLPSLILPRWLLRFGEIFRLIQFSR